MTERGSGDFPDGSVGRYVRERWGVPAKSPVPSSTRVQDSATARSADSIERVDAGEAEVPGAERAEPGERTAAAGEPPKADGAGEGADSLATNGADEGEGPKAADEHPPATNGTDDGERAAAADGAREEEHSPATNGTDEDSGVGERPASAEPTEQRARPTVAGRTGVTGDDRPFARRVSGEPTRRAPRGPGDRARPISWPRDEVRARHAAPDADEVGETARTLNGSADHGRAHAADAGEAERAAAREMWAFEATEIRPATPRPSAPTLEVRNQLSTDRLLRRGRRVPQSGWRRWVYRLSGRMINPGESPAEAHRRELTARVNQPLLGCYKIAMLSLKGGVGKTTMTATLGATFASMRGDRVVAVDANPDRGTLSQKIPLETSATVRHLLRDAQRVRRYTDVRAYTSQGPSRLEVLASEQDPAVSEAFAEEDYRRTITLLEHFYNIVLTDCGTGLMHSAMYGVLGLADQLVIVSSGSIDGARSASATMDWLDAHGHGDLVRNGVAVINSVHRRHGPVHLERVAEHFAARCRAVVRIPFDPHLEEGAEIDLDRLEPETRLALLELAAAVADAFSSQPARA